MTTISLDDPRFGNLTPTFIVHEGEVWLLLNGYRGKLNDGETLCSKKHGRYQKITAREDYGIIERITPEGHSDIIFIPRAKQVSAGNGPRKVTGYFIEDFISAVALPEDLKLPTRSIESMTREYFSLLADLGNLTKEKVPEQHKEEWKQERDQLWIRIKYGIYAVQMGEPIPQPCDLDRVTKDMTTLKLFYQYLTETNPERLGSE